MQPIASAPSGRTLLPEASALRKYAVEAMVWSFIGLLYLLLPLLPLVASIAYGRIKYTAEYWTTLKKMVVHLKAVAEAPVFQHYFLDVAGKQASVPAQIQGSCTQCGNCCLDKRCTFLEQTADGKYICGVYHARLRRYSNCGSFPLSAQDIERYDCPGYTVVQEQPIHWVKRAA